MDKVLMLVLVCICACVTISAKANEYRCPETQDLLIVATDDQMVDYVCDAAQRTFAFLGKYKLTLKRPIRIEIVERSVNHNGYLAYGSFERQRDLISIMSLSSIKTSMASPTMYNMPFDEDQYIGAIAHEISHALFTQNAPLIEDKWNNAAQEYLAHATQLGVLPEGLRKIIIDKEGTEAWESGDEISVTYMAFNPTGFAVKSYLHLMKLDDPQKFVDLLLNHKWLYVSVP